MNTGNTSSIPSSIYDFVVKDIDGNDFDFSQLKGKKLIIVNTASKCGHTPQYAELERIYQQYKSKNVEIIAFPSNNFLWQEPGTNAAIKEFCSVKYKITFPIMSKISVRGKRIEPIYSWLTLKENNGVANARVTWNFQKFLISDKGQWVGSIPPGESPENSKTLINFIQQ